MDPSPKTGNSNQGPRKKGKESKSVLGGSTTGNPSQVVDIPKVSPNPFAVLSSSEAILEEGELQQFDGNELDSEGNTIPKEHAGPSLSAPPLDGGPPYTSPIDASSPLSYADITRKKQVVSSGSSNDDSFEQLSKKAGRKSKKEIREEEFERIKTQGCHATIEMSYGRNKRTRPPKGVITPSNLGK